MKLRVLKPIVVLILLLTSFVNSRRLTRAKSTKILDFFFKTDIDLDTDLKLIENPASDGKLIQEFVLGLLSTIGIIGASKLSSVFSLILDNQLIYYFTEDDIDFKCTKDGFFKYIEHYTIKSYNDEQKLKFGTCQEQKNKLEKRIKEFSKLYDCARDISFDRWYHGCKGDDLKNYQAYMKENGMKESETSDNHIHMTRIYGYLNDDFAKIKCENEAVNGALEKVIQKFKQGFFTVKFGMRCDYHFKENIAMFAFSAVLNVIVNFLSTGIYTILKLTMIVIKMMYSAYLLIKDYSIKALRYKRIGEIMGFLIRIGLELIMFPIMESPFFVSKSRRRLRKRLN